MNIDVEFAEARGELHGAIDFAAICTRAAIRSAAEKERDRISIMIGFYVAEIRFRRRDARCGIMKK